MKQLITILLCLITFFAEAQVNTNDTNKYFKSYDYGFSYKRLQAREAFIMPTDTVINKLGAVSLNGAIYLGNGVKWTSIGGGGSLTDTTSLSNRINQRIDSLRRRSDSVFARKNGVFIFQYKDSIGGSTIDTTSLSNRINLKIDSLKRSNDSVYAYRNGTRVFQFKDSVGGGGTTPSLQQVLDVNATAYNKNVYFYDTTNGGGAIDFINFNFQKFGSSDYMEIKHNNNYSRNLAERIYFQSGGASISIGQNFDLSSQQDAFMSIGFNDYSQAASGFHKLKSGSSFSTPFTTTIPPVTGTLALSVNGNTADANGNITISTSGIDSLKRSADSVYARKNGNFIFQFKDSVGTNPAPVGYYGAFQDTTTQTAALINTAYGVKLGVTDLSNGVTISNNTRIKIANAGIYNIQFSLQLEKSGGSGNMIADIWLRKNGVNLDGTAGKIVLTGSANASPVVAAWNYVIAVSSNDSLELMWATSNDNVVIKASPATAPHPSIPSAIITVTQQSGIMAGTGISPLDTANMLSNYARTNLVNTKLNISDTSSFQRKSIPSYTFLANNTPATASAQALPFKDTSGVFTSSIVYNNGTAPTSGNLTYRWTRIGKMVTINISLVYANAGSGNSSITIGLPSDAPTPTKPAGLTSASNLLYPCLGGINATNQSTLSNSAFRGFLRNNAANNGFEFFVNHGTTTPINVFVTCTYFTD